MELHLNNWWPFKMHSTWFFLRKYLKKKVFDNSNYIDNKKDIKIQMK